jgi:hypothetical protein
MATFGLAFTAIFLALGLSWPAVLLIALPYLVGVAVLLKQKFGEKGDIPLELTDRVEDEEEALGQEISQSAVDGQKAPSQPLTFLERWDRAIIDQWLADESHPDLHRSAAPMAKKLTAQGQLKLQGKKAHGHKPTFLALLALLALAGCGGAAKGKIEPLSPLDPALAALGQGASGVLWRQGLFMADPQFPLRFTAPKSLRQPGGLALAWSGPAGEAALALAKSLGYAAKIDSKASQILVEMRPDPSLSAYGHVQSLNQAMYPRAGIFVDSVNRILTLKPPPFD